MRTCNGYLAVGPFPDKGIEAKTSNGFATIKQKNTLTMLPILFGSEKFPGGHVWVSSSVHVTQFAREVYELNGLSFILIPESEVRIFNPSIEFAPLQRELVGVPEGTNARAVPKALVGGIHPAFTVGGTKLGNYDY